jgi:hypothetical protein
MLKPVIAIRSFDKHKSRATFQNFNLHLRLIRYLSKIKSSTQTVAIYFTILTLGTCLCSCLRKDPAIQLCNKGHQDTYTTPETKTHHVQGR